MPTELENNEILTEENNLSDNENHPIIDAISAIMDNALEVVGVNLVRAGNRFLSSLFDNAASKIRANTTEHQAASQVRTSLIHHMGDQLRQELSVSPELIEKTQSHLENEIIRDRTNLKQIFSRACEILASKILSDSDSNDTGLEEEISEEWLDTIVPEAKQKSTEYMQELFARVLAGEIMRPGSFSILSTKIMSSLDQKTAELFVQLCSMGLCFESELPDIRICALGGAVGTGSLSEYGITYSSWSILEEHRLVSPDITSFYQLVPCRYLIPGKDQVICYPFKHQEKHWILKPMSVDMVDKEFKVYGVGLTGVGRDLANIVTTKPVPKYTSALVQFFETQGYKMIQTGGSIPEIIYKSEIV